MTHTKLKKGSATLREFGGSVRKRKCWVGSAAIVALATAGLLVTTSLTATHSQAGANSAGSEQGPLKPVPAVIGCTTKVWKNNVKWGQDTWQVGLECTGNPTDKVIYVRGVLDVPSGFDQQTAWVEIPPNTAVSPPKQAVSPGATSPWGNPTSRVEEYKCPPVSIGQCSPSNRYNQAVLAFGDLLSNLF